MNFYRNRHFLDEKFYSDGFKIVLHCEKTIVTLFFLDAFGYLGSNI